MVLCGIRESIDLKKYVLSLLSVAILFFSLINISYADLTSDAQKKRCLVNAYAPFIYLDKGTIKDQKGRSLIWNDGRSKTFNEKLNKPDLEDTLSIPYPAFQPVRNPAYQEDPGRFRNQELLQMVYGRSKRAIRKNLVYVDWVNHSDTQRIRFNRQNGAAKALQKVVIELQQLPASYRKYFNNIGGTFNFRRVAGTNRLSAHSYGIAIDLSVPLGDYWRYSSKNLHTDKIHYKNRIPKTIVDIFERHCFIWGGRWYHYDTMHFEYRPELFCNQCD